MVYLIIMVLLAGAGLARLWLAQRRQVTHLSTVEGFRSSLERLSGPTADSSDAGQQQDARRRPARASKGSQVLDPERRAAAKRRLEERRRASRSSVRPS